MTRTTSVYLDLVRVSAALCVLLYHASADQFGGRWLYPIFGEAGTDAVTVFFVLSGFVISYTADTKERTARSFFVNRFARLWSVALPAIALTLLLDTIGHRLAPDVYTISASPFDNIIERSLAAALFVNQIGFADINMLSNVPFWSLSYEFWYYVTFGLAMFFPGPRGIWLAALAIAIMGPKILLLFPVWLMGVWVQKNAHRLRMSPAPAAALFLAAPLGCLMMHHWGLMQRFAWHIETLTNHNLVFSNAFITANLFGALVAAHFVGFFSLENYFAPILAKLQTIIRWAAGYTFSIYLYHVPLLLFFAALSTSSSPNDPLRNGLIILSTLCAVVAVGTVTERKKHILRAYLELFSNRLLPRSAP